jgi:aminopeptidase N
MIPHRRYRFSYCLLTCFALLAFAISAFAARQERMLDKWKPVHYNITISLDEQLTEIRATTQITVVTLKDNVIEIDLDFGDLDVDSVSVDGNNSPYERANGRLNVKLLKPVAQNTKLIVAVSYHGKPKDGLILAKDKAGRPSAIGDNWPDRLHHWIPTFDHPSAKATVRFTVSGPDRVQVVANGKFESVETRAIDTRTWTYNESVPIPPYCMIIAVGEFARLTPPEQQITPLAYYVPLPDKDLALNGFAAAYPSLKYFTETIAPYPYEKLDLIVGTTRFGGMENSSAIVFSSTLFAPQPAAPVSKTFNIRAGIVRLVAHEIAHQWFGDSVTESTWADLWLSEGFATYFAGLFLQKTEGEAAFREYMATARNTYLKDSKGIRTPLHDTETADLMRLLNANNYQKGAWVLHMLRSELGDAHFIKGIQHYYRTHKDGTANSEDLRSSFEAVSKRNLKPFFQSWVYGAGHPRYQLTSRWNAKTKRLRLMLHQQQDAGAFPNKLPVEITTRRGTQIITLEPIGKATSRVLRLAERPTNIRIDPYEAVLKEAVVETK